MLKLVKVHRVHRVHNIYQKQLLKKDVAVEETKYFYDYLFLFKNF